MSPWSLFPSGGSPPVDVFPGVCYNGANRMGRELEGLRNISR